MARPREIRHGYKQNLFLGARQIAILRLLTAKKKFPSLSRAAAHAINEQARIEDLDVKKLVEMEADIIATRKSPYPEKKES